MVTAYTYKVYVYIVDCIRKVETLTPPLTGSKEPNLTDLYQ